MKNQYNNFIKYMSKADVFALQRVDDFYYVSDGKIMVKLSELDYRYFFQPVSGLYIPLENGENARSRSRGELPEKGAGMNAADIYNGIRPDRPAVKTPFMYEIREGKKITLNRVFVGVNQQDHASYITVAETLVNAAPYFCGELRSNGGDMDPLKWEGDNGNGVIIMPKRDGTGAVPAFLNNSKAV